MALFESWKQELDRKYLLVVSQGSEELIGEANLAVMATIRRMNRIINKHKEKLKRGER